MKYRVATFLIGVSALVGCGPHDSDSTATPAAASPGAAAAAPSSAAAAAPRCALDTFDGQLVPHDGTAVDMSAGQKFVAHGWLVDATMNPPGGFQFRLTSTDGNTTRDFAGQTDVLRSDVAKALKSESAALSGYDVSVDLGDLPSGTYKAFAAGTGWQCNLSATLTIAPAK